MPRAARGTHRPESQSGNPPGASVSKRFDLPKIQRRRAAYVLSGYTPPGHPLLEGRTPTGDLDFTIWKMGEGGGAPCSLCEMRGARKGETRPAGHPPAAHSWGGSLVSPSGPPLLPPPPQGAGLSAPGRTTFSMPGGRHTEPAFSRYAATTCRRAGPRVAWPVVKPQTGSPPPPTSAASRLLTAGPAKCNLGSRAYLLFLVH